MLYDKGVFPFCHKAIRNAGVIGAEYHLKIPLKADNQLIILVLDFRFFIKMGSDFLIDRLSFYFRYFRITSENGAVIQFHSNFGRLNKDIS